MPLCPLALRRGENFQLHHLKPRSNLKEKRRNPGMLKRQSRGQTKAPFGRLPLENARILSCIRPAELLLSYYMVYSAAVPQTFPEAAPTPLTGFCMWALALSLISREESGEQPISQRAAVQAGAAAGSRSHTHTAGVVALCGGCFPAGDCSAPLLLAGVGPGKEQP